MGDLSTHFSFHEFECQCGCGFDEIDFKLIVILEDMRYHFKDKSIKINSGCRCPAYNKAIGGVKNSQHIKGTAADIVVKDIRPSEVYTYLTNQYPNIYGIGRYNTFTHIDVRSRKARW